MSGFPFEKKKALLFEKRKKNTVICDVNIKFIVINTRKVYIIITIF